MQEFRLRANTCDSSQLRIVLLVDLVCMVSSHVLYKDLIHRRENGHHFIGRKAPVDKSLYRDAGLLVIRDKQMTPTRCHRTAIRLATIVKFGHAKYLRMRNSGNSHPLASEVQGGMESGDRS